MTADKITADDCIASIDAVIDKMQKMKKTLLRSDSMAINDYVDLYLSAQDDFGKSLADGVLIIKRRQNDSNSV